MISNLLNFKSVAVIGAAREEGKVGNVIFKNLIKNKDLRVFPVNPNADDIFGFPCYQDVTKIKEDIDCAIIIVRPEFILKVMQGIVKKKIKSVIIVSAGFSEAGNSELEEKIIKIAEKNKIFLLGPNVLGILTPHSKINASFFKGMPKQGGIAFLSQSGAIGTAILDESYSQNIGFSSFVSLGNSAVLDFSDFIYYFSEDKETKVIAIYMEALKGGKGAKFIETCKKCKKPIVILKAGKTKEGARAAESHTSALASEKEIYDGIFRQAGILQVESIKELFLVAKMFENNNIHGKRACVITNAGGLGVLCADALSSNGIELPALSESLVKRLSLFLPSSWSKNNPVDILGDALAERYEKTIKVLENDKNFDFFIFLLTPQYMTQADEIAKAVLNSKKPAIACFLGGFSVEGANERLKQKIPIFDDVKDMAEVLGKVVEKK